MIDWGKVPEAGCLAFGAAMRRKWDAQRELAELTERLEKRYRWHRGQPVLNWEAAARAQSAARDPSRYLPAGELIDWLCERGMSLTMNWREDTAAWEVDWITGGGRFSGAAPDLRAALIQAFEMSRQAKES